ncbi:MAG: two-component system response regulator [Humidesulfovibrio sp.]|nr:two-component system response regulator [Humidesulfovibrio sp.]
MLNPKPKVLVVDDTPDNIHILMEMLKDDYAIVVAINGERALAMASRKPMPDIILLDVMMPGMDGYETCARLKANPETRDIPVLFVTALSDEASEARGLDLGAVDFVTKPFTPSLVKARIHNQMELKLHRDNLEKLVRLRTQEVEKIKDVAIESLASLVEYRDPETGNHIVRTKAFVLLLAEHLCRDQKFMAALPPEVIELLHKSAPLHDIGKVGVPDAILNKPGCLTMEEFEIMKTHTTIGYEALRGVEARLGNNSFFRYAREIAHSHHERWDGEGYPLGLAGEDIPLSGRIMAIADVYDALTSKRVYKGAMPHEDAARIIVEGRGTHFDPSLVDAFITLQESFRRIAQTHSDNESEPQSLRPALLEMAK